MSGRGRILALRALHAQDRLRLRLLRARHPGLSVDPAASACLAHGRFQLAPGARVHFAAGVVTERLAGALQVSAEAGAEISVGEGTWLRTELGPVQLVAFAGARLRIGPESLLNGCHLSAKAELRLGRRAFVGPGTRIFDADQHDLDAERPEQRAPVRLGDHVWVASDVTVLRGVEIGDHSVIGARSVVSSDIPPHTLAYGVPARPRGIVGDRSRAR